METGLLSADFGWKILNCAAGGKSNRKNVEDGN